MMPDTSRRTQVRRVLRVAIGTVCVVVLLCGGLVPPAAAWADSSDALDDSLAASSGELTVVLEAGDYRISQTDRGSWVDMDGFGQMLVPGRPMLPSMVFLVGLPPGAEASGIEIKDSKRVSVPGTYDIMPAPPLASAGQAPQPQLRDDAVYSSSGPYPSAPCDYLSAGRMRKYSVARVRFSPIAYYPAEGRLELYQWVELAVEYTVSEVPPADVLADTAMDDVAREAIVNYKAIAPRYRVAAPASPRVGYDYVVVTTDSLTGAVQSLLSWKAALGYSTNVVTTSWINDNYAGAGLADRIRGFLADKYAAWGTRYVLLVGSHSTVPMKYCYANPNNHSSSSSPTADGRTPTDYYYADLTGSWDSDGDGYYGEYGQDDVDFYPEVYVGRIPFDDAETVAAVCDKLVAFEQDGGSWKQRALLLGAISNYQNQDHSGWPKTDGAALMELCRQDMLGPGGYTTQRMYEREGLSPSIYAGDYPLTNTDVCDAGYGWPSGYGVVNWAAHGGSCEAARLVWTSDDGDGVPESFELSRPKFIHSSDAAVLDDSRPAIVFASSCLTAYPEEALNLGHALVGQGAAGFVGATRVSWYTVGWQDSSHGGIDSIDYYFFDYLVNDAKPCGDALYLSKVYYLDHFTQGPFAPWGWQHWQNLFGFCLYGDPSIGTASYTPVQVAIDAPAEVGVDAEFTAQVTISQVEDFDSCNYDLFYDPDVVEVTDVTAGLMGEEEVPVVWGFVPQDTQGRIRLIQNVPGVDGVSGQGYLARVHFQAMDGACNTSALDLRNGKLNDNRAQPILAEWTDGSVHITDVVPGDANGDGRVNAADITMVERIMLMLDPETPGADVNGDGRINAADITRIERIMLMLD